MTASTWTKATIDRERARVSETLAAAAPPTRLAVAVEEVLAASTAGAPLARRFLLACAVLDLHARGGGLTAGQVAKVGEIASSVLRIANIHPTTSKLSFLYAELHDALQRIHVRDGQHADAFWDLHVAHQLSRKAPLHGPETRLCRAVEADLRLGYAEAARARLALAAELLERKASGGEAWFLALAARVAWVTGDDEGLARALAALAGVGGAGGDGSADARATGAWLQALAAARPEADFQPLLAEVAAGRHPAFELDAAFLARALPGSEAQKRVRSFRQLRDAHRSDPASEVALRCLGGLEQAQEDERPLHHRLRILQRTWRDAERLPRVESQRLAEASVIRALLALNQMELAASLLSAYRSACLGLTLGRRDDLFGLLGDVRLDVLLRRYVGA